MPSGNHYKFNGSEIQILTSYDDSPGSMAVSAISQANPAIATVDSSTILGATGDIGVVKFSSVEGMEDLDERVVIVQVASGTTLTLLGVDSTGYNAFTGSAIGAPGVFTTWCEPTSLNRQGDAAPEIDATTVCSTFQEFERGLVGFGNVTIDFHFAPKTTVQQAIAAFELSGDITALRYALPNNGGETIVQGFISQTSEQGSNGTLWTGSLNFRSTGAPVRVID